MTRQILMIDADDTLWENNIYFERAIDRFIEVVAHPTFSPAEVRSAFDALEAERVKAHGYGTDAFHASLLAGFAHLTGAVCDQASAAEIEACAMHVRGSELVLLQDVAETLSQLAHNHTLFLVTKGDHAEQTTKLVRSGLAKYFSQVEVLREKNESAYLELIRRHGLDPTQTWMIGNSPRSDINPALAAGLHAVYLPHPSTWVLEQEAIATAADPQHLLELASFKDLLLYFE
ncbi:MAG: HAD family hydrolase [Janthinobacterium lividum]